MSRIMWYTKIFSVVSAIHHWQCYSRQQHCFGSRSTNKRTGCQDEHAPARQRSRSLDVPLRPDCRRRSFLVEEPAGGSGGSSPRSQVLQADGSCHVSSHTSQLPCLAILLPRGWGRTQRGGDQSEGRRTDRRLCRRSHDSVGLCNEE